MKDVSKQYRIAVAAALQGVISVNVYDEKKWVTESDDQFVILSTQQQTPTENNDCTWITRNSIDIEIYDKTNSEVSKNAVDDISNQICEALLPAPFSTGLTSANIQFTNAFVESIISRNLSISETQSILQKIIRFVVVIVQQT